MFERLRQKLDWWVYCNAPFLCSCGHWVRGKGRSRLEYHVTRGWTTLCPACYRSLYTPFQDKAQRRE